MKTFFKILSLYIVVIGVSFAQIPVGMWKVVDVVIDRESTVTQSFRMQDPIYMNRIFIFGENEIVSDFYQAGQSVKCNNPKFVVDKENSNQLTLSCRSIFNNSVLTWKNADQIILKPWEDSLALIELEKVGTVSPSFSCDKAQNFAEKTICGDVYLSGLDLSLKEAYSYAKKYSEQDNLTARQRLFLKKRNECITTDCLKEIMYEQLIFLRDQALLITNY